MREIRQEIGGFGNLMFKEAYLMGQVLDGNIPDVYVQGEKYWKQHAANIKAKFSEGIVPVDAVAIHIRRGDYLKAHHFHVNLWETEYYKKALALFPLETKFIVFCKDNQGWEQDKEDRQWCRENVAPLLRGASVEMPPKENTEAQDFNLMAGCRGIVMANSSFSWFAAYLSKNAIITCPTQWYVDGIQRTELLDEWIKV